MMRAQTLSRRFSRLASALDEEICQRQPFRKTRTRLRPNTFRSTGRLPSRPSLNLLRIDRLALRTESKAAACLGTLVR